MHDAQTTSHGYRITYRSWNRTKRAMLRHHAYAEGRSRWGALRAWWQVERLWHNPAVEVVSITLDHRRCAIHQYPRGWSYACQPPYDL